MGDEEQAGNAVAVGVGGRNPCDLPYLLKEPVYCRLAHVGAEEDVAGPVAAAGALPGDRDADVDTAISWEVHESVFSEQRASESL
ncbi:hypothetical protein GCM10017600_26320 [Streptosporangium carneum]|uniref:Uncharacterized protein n=1 Tax=Streptosporangium carneum TaxID=47481 RepID=A0A9W6HZK5_9ACTN|nr:hypothetical protein GCM10017600_26320 [Streptosporangium carneum]